LGLGTVLIARWIIGKLACGLGVSGAAFDASL
jgi:hypothetical protein